MKLKIVIPSRTVTEIETDLVTLPGTKGVFGVMPGHAKLIANLKIGLVKARFGDDERLFYVHRGTVQVTGKDLNVISEFAEDLADVKIDKIKTKIQEIEAKLASIKDDLEEKIAQERLARYNSLLQFAS